MRPATLQRPSHRGQRQAARRNGHWHRQKCVAQQRVRPRAEPVRQHYCWRCGPQRCQLPRCCFQLGAEAEEAQRFREAVAGQFQLQRAQCLAGPRLLLRLRLQCLAELRPVLRLRLWYQRQAVRRLRQPQDPAAQPALLSPQPGCLRPQRPLQPWAQTTASKAAGMRLVHPPH